jgi:hypothetical protein
LLETVRESSDSALQEATIFAEYGVKTKDLRSLEKSRNSGIFDVKFPEFRGGTVQGLIIQKQQMLRLSREHANNPLLKKVSVSSVHP